jgi:hypothetical protein
MLFDDSEPNVKEAALTKVHAFGVDRKTVVRCFVIELPFVRRLTQPMRRHLRCAGLHVSRLVGGCADREST